MIFRSEKMRPLLALVYVVGWAMAFPLIKLGYAEMGIESAGDLGNKILFAGVRFLAAGLLLILLSLLQKKELHSTKSVLTVRMQLHFPKQ